MLRVARTALIALVFAACRSPDPVTLTVADIEAVRGGVRVEEGAAGARADTVLRVRPGASVRTDTQGRARLALVAAGSTVWELARAGVPHTLITDSMASIVMREGRVKKVFVGADRVARNGDFANKVGTYGVAVLAKHHGVPFHPVAPFTTVDLACARGDDIEIEQRAAEEVRGVRGSFGEVRWAPEGCAVFNPAFDVTPAALVTSLVLDRGVFTPEAFAAHCARG